MARTLIPAHRVRRRPLPFHPVAIRVRKGGWSFERGEFRACLGYSPNPSGQRSLRRAADRLAEGYLHYCSWQM